MLESACVCDPVRECVCVCVRKGGVVLCACVCVNVKARACMCGHVCVGACSYVCDGM